MDSVGAVVVVKIASTDNVGAVVVVKTWTALTPSGLSPV